MMALNNSGLGEGIKLNPDRATRRYFDGMSRLTDKIIDHYLGDIRHLLDADKKDEARQLDNEYRQLRLPYVNGNGNLIYGTPTEIIFYRVREVFRRNPLSAKERETMRDIIRSLDCEESDTAVTK